MTGPQNEWYSSLIPDTFGDQLTDRARDVLFLARRHSNDSGRHFTTPEDVLWGFTRSSSGMAISILRDMGLTHGPTFDEAEPETPIPCEGDRTLNPALQEMFSSAVQQAEAFGHNYIGTEHLLLGLLSGNSPAALWLRQRGIDLATVRGEVERHYC